MVWTDILMNWPQLEHFRLLQERTVKAADLPLSRLLLSVAVPLLVLRSAGCWQPTDYRWLQLRSKCAWTHSVWPSTASLIFTQVGEMLAHQLRAWLLLKPFRSLRTVSWHCLCTEKSVPCPSILKLNYFWLALFCCFCKSFCICEKNTCECFAEEDSALLHQCRTPLFKWQMLNSGRQ